MVVTHIIRTLHSFRFSQIREFPLCACNPKHVYSWMWVYCSELPSPLLGSPLLISHFEGLTWVNFPWPGLCFDCISPACRSMWCDAISVMADLSGNKLVRLHRHVVVSLIMVYSECVQCNLTMTPEMRTPINSCSLNAISLAYIYIYICWNFVARPIAIHQDWEQKCTVQTVFFPRQAMTFRQCTHSKFVERRVYGTVADTAMLLW